VSAKQNVMILCDGPNYEGNVMGVALYGGGNCEGAVEGFDSTDEARRSLAADGWTTNGEADRCANCTALAQHARSAEGPSGPTTSEPSEQDTHAG
jgi:hypothetical protein